MISQDVTIPVDGSQMSAYLARPEEQSGPHPAVIVLQEIFGFTPEVKRVTELLPTIGYAGLAINYYHRTHPRLNAAYTEAGYREAMDAATGITADSLMRDVSAAAAWLNEQPFIKHGKIATWGAGFGANAAFITSSLTQLSGAICFYPTHLATPLPSGGEQPLEHAGEVHIPLLVIFGEDDYYVPRNDMERIRETLTRANKEIKMQIYPGVGHSFFRHGRPEAIAEQNRYSDEAIAQAVADSWGLVKVFLADVFNRPQRHAVETGDIRTERREPVR
jgi:carboxymethylenebutenolidase